MARNRKRAKDRRARRPASPDARVAIARGGRVQDDAPLPGLEHATPDVEIAEAQLALGRPELEGDQTPEEIEALVEEEEREGEEHDKEERERRRHDGLEEDEYDEEELEAVAVGGRDGAGELAPAGAPAPARVLPGGRFVNFLRGCWRELQRVQWPDRRQVVQATGVVIGFVIVAGLFLGGADWVSQKLVSLILK